MRQNKGASADADRATRQSRSQSSLSPPDGASVPSAGDVTIPRELFDFLMGRAPLQGTWFGDLNLRLPGRFWWRALLRCCDASAGEAGTATTTKIGVVHEHAVGEAETPKPGQESSNGR